MKDLIRLLLIPDPSKRLTVHAIIHIINNWDSIKLNLPVIIHHLNFTRMKHKKSRISKWVFHFSLNNSHKQELIKIYQQMIFLRFKKN